MLSGKLIHLIESHEQKITDRLIREIRRHPDLTHLRHLSEAELRERSQSFLANLGYWLAEDNEQDLAKQYEALGRSRCEESIPLHESVHALCLIKRTVIDFVDEQGIPPDALSLYAEEELEHRLSRLFDDLVIHMVRGYENSWNRAAHVPA